MIDRDLLLSYPKLLAYYRQLIYDRKSHSNTFGGSDKPIHIASFSSAFSDKTADLAIYLADLDDEISLVKAKLDSVNSFIDNFNDPLFRRILKYRIRLDLPWRVVASRLSSSSKIYRENSLNHFFQRKLAVIFHD